MTVYIVQQPKPNKNNWTPDLSSASQYGKIEYVFDPSERVYALPGPSLFKAKKLMRNSFNEEEDYIVWPSAGDPMAFAAVLLAITELNLFQVQFLMWDRKRDDSGNRTNNSGFYVPIKFKLREKKDDSS